LVHVGFFESFAVLFSAFTPAILGDTFILIFAFWNSFLPIVIARTPLAGFNAGLALSLLRGKRRRLPLYIASFLDDAYRLGLLRAVGPAYQFRHAELQDYLAQPEGRDRQR
jgi:hypothetical protein